MDRLSSGRKTIGAYFVRHEHEANGGYADLLLEPDLLRYPGVKLTRLSVVFHGGNMVLCDDLRSA